MHAERGNNMNGLRSLAAAALLVVAGCTSTADIADQPLEAGNSQAYNADFATVNAATLATLQTMDLNITNVTEDDRGAIYSVQDPISAFSWGEVGRVFVARRAEPPTIVYSLWETRLDGQITGTQQSDFSAELFPGIASRLP